MDRQPDMFPCYRRRADRVRTFHNVAIANPNRNFFVRNAEELARVGLFYYCDPDRLRCFHCGVIIYDWFNSDLSFADRHFYANQNCNYVIWAIH